LPIAGYNYSTEGPLPKVYPHLLAGALAGVLAAAAWCVAAADEHGDTSKVVPVKGTVQLSNTKFDGGLRCTALGLLAKTVKPDPFDAMLTWGDGKVDVNSPNGEFTCSLQGTDGFVGSKPCQFYVGGGDWRTQVTCEGAKVKGTRAGNGLEVSAGACSAKLKECTIESDLTVSLKPR